MSIFKPIRSLAIIFLLVFPVCASKNFLSRSQAGHLRTADAPFFSGVLDGIQQAFTGRAPVATVDIYFQTYCPNCHRIFENYLPEVMTSLGSYVNVRLLPGAAQHGPSEYLGNMIQACAINIYDQSVHIPFVICMASAVQRSTIDDAADTCAAHSDIDMTRISQCVQSDHGSELMNSIAQATPDRVRYAPWVEVNGEHWDIDEDIKEHVCQKLSSPPNWCYVLLANYHPPHDEEDDRKEKKPCHRC
mmetsp:Transcript_6269/g.11596  ORF Transcript_6269/g.11596 Transcript_6269/m.11596 type:complete len:246 (+) Transcript_6269:54-791(+)